MLYHHTAKVSGQDTRKQVYAFTCLSVCMSVLSHQSCASAYDMHTLTRHTHTLTQTHTRHTLARTHARTHARSHAHTLTLTLTLTHTHRYTHTRTHTRTHTHLIATT